MARSDTLTKTLKQLVTNTPDIEAAALVDNDGLMIANVLDSSSDDDAVAAMSAALLGISERISDQLNRGAFQMVMTRGTDGYVVLVRCSNEAVLTVLTTSSAKLGLVFMDVRRASDELSKLIG
jgi:hypothetical protein